MSGTGGNMNLGGGFMASGGNNSGSGGNMACAGTTTKATLIPLDIYLMLDSSGSMGDKTGANMMGPTKWDAITQALTTFFKDPASAGLGLGLNFFPLADPSVPATCSSNADCGQHGPCLLKTCDNVNVVTPCNTNADCNGGNCAQLGQCFFDPNTLCLPVGGLCGGGLGPCLALSNSVCLSPDSCANTDYATPAVEIAQLNGAAGPLTAAIMAHSPGGATPTAPALHGVIDHASAWATMNPTHKVVALLATDGLPTECSPLDIPSISAIAQSGVNGNPSVPTFVIGVFAAADAAAKANLDAIASAGGTTSAFIVDPNANVEQAFLDALNKIRGQKIACEFQIPDPPMGQTLDYMKVNVQYTAPGAPMAKTIFYVGSAAKCDPMTGGWYYDIDPTKGTPTKIIMCQQTCDSFGGTGQVDIQLGCATEEPPVK
jgi:hypothetical protein